jgi:hypothetical protein
MLTLAGGLNANPLLFPASEWGPGGVNIFLTVAYNQGSPPVGQDICTTGFGSGNTGSSCTITDTGTGTSTGTATAYNDVNGIHVDAEVASAGQEGSTAEALSAFTDTVTNNSLVTATFQVGFHVDGQLSDNGGATSFLFVDVWHGYALSTIQDSVVGTQNFQYSLSGSNPTATLVIDQDLLTNAITLSPGASYTYSISMDAYSVTEQGGGVALDNPVAITDVSNTLAIDSFTAMDQNGNSLPASDFGSSAGVDYASIQGSSTPEPATSGICGILALAMLAQIRRVAKHPRS